MTYLDPGLCAEGPMPRTNNRIEGGVNAQLREMMRNHRGMSEVRRVKAVFWWCRRGRLRRDAGGLAEMRGVEDRVLFTRGLQ
jgi:hypothetical protein